MLQETTETWPDRKLYHMANIKFEFLENLNTAFSLAAQISKLNFLNIFIFDLNIKFITLNHSKNVPDYHSKFPLFYLRFPNSILSYFCKRI